MYGTTMMFTSIKTTEYLKQKHTQHWRKRTQDRLHKLIGYVSDFLC